MCLQRVDPLGAGAGYGEAILYVAGLVTAYRTVYARGGTIQLTILTRGSHV